MFAPDGLGTQACLWLIALSSIACFAIFGHRLGARGVRHIVGRLGALTASVIVSVLAVTATLNAHYGWYGSWDDIAATVTGNSLHGEAQIYGASPKARRQQREAERRHDVIVNKTANEAFVHDRSRFEKRIPRPAAGADGVWFKENVPGIPMKGRDIGRVMIWVPKSYFAQPRRQYPVIEAFHGMPGGTLDYERVFFLDRLVAKAVTKKQMNEAIIVVPQEMPGGIDTECVNGGGLSMETWLSKTVPDYIVQHLRVDAAPSSWVALGASAGGWCASMLGLLHPERYGALVSLGGYFTPNFDGWDPFAKSGVPERYDLVRQVRTHPTSQDIWLLISGADKLSKASTEEFAKNVRAPNSLTTMTYPNAGHRVEVWVQALPSALSWLGKTVPAFAPQH